MNKKEPKYDYLGAPPRREMSKFEVCLLCLITTIGLVYIFYKFLEI